MINIEKAKKELEFHIQKLEKKDNKTLRKEGHMYRVANISKKIAIALGLSQEHIQLAELIGLLHDIGRFEQYKKFDEKIDSKELDNIQVFDHGKAGVEVLKENNYIRKFCEEKKYDDIIYTAIYEHNKYELTKGLEKDKELFCKIIKDADKIDLLEEAVFVYWQTPEEIKKIEEGNLSTKMLQDFYNHKLANNRNRISQTDQILRFASFIYDIYFPHSYEIIKENDSVNKMISRFDYKLQKTKEEMMKIKKIANEYIKEKTK